MWKNLHMKIKCCTFAFEKHAVESAPILLQGSDLKEKD